MVAERPQREQEALASYGWNLGMAFQLVDDALDYSADESVLGKTVGDDFREGKITLPVLAAYHAGTPAERAFWSRTIETLEQAEGDLDQALGLMERCGALAVTTERAHRFAASAKQALAVFPSSELQQCLLAVADFTSAGLASGG